MVNKTFLFLIFVIPIICITAFFTFHVQHPSSTSPQRLHSKISEREFKAILEKRASLNNFKIEYQIEGLTTLSRLLKSLEISNSGVGKEVIYKKGQAALYSFSPKIQKVEITFTYTLSPSFYHIHIYLIDDILIYCAHVGTVYKELSPFAKQKCVTVKRPTGVTLWTLTSFDFNDVLKDSEIYFSGEREIASRMAKCFDIIKKVHVKDESSDIYICLDKKFGFLVLVDMKVRRPGYANVLAASKIELKSFELAHVTKGHIAPPIPFMLRSLKCDANQINFSIKAFRTIGGLLKLTLSKSTRWETHSAEFKKTLSPVYIKPFDEKDFNIDLDMLLDKGVKNVKVCIGKECQEATCTVSFLDSWPDWSNPDVNIVDAADYCTKKISNLKYELKCLDDLTSCQKEQGPKLIPICDRYREIVWQNRDSKLKWLIFYDVYNVARCYADAAYYGDANDSICDSLSGYTFEGEGRGPIDLRAECEKKFMRNIIDLSDNNCEHLIDECLGRISDLENKINCIHEIEVFKKDKCISLHPVCEELKELVWRNRALGKLQQGSLFAKMVPNCYVSMALAMSNDSPCDELSSYVFEYVPEGGYKKTSLNWAEYCKERFNYWKNLDMNRG
jgi:hypothetical protein